MLFGSANRDGRGVRARRRPRPRPRPEPVPLLRRRDPLLPRGAAGQARARDRLRDAAPARAPTRAGRAAAGGSRRSSCAASSRSASGSDGRCATSRSATRTRSGHRSRRPTAGRTGWWPRSARTSRRSSSWRTSASTATPRPTSSETSCPPSTSLRPEFVSVLIGVNDVVQGVRPEVYAANVERILETLLARLAPTRIVTVATPDYTVTPAGADYGDPRQPARRDRRRERDPGTRRGCAGDRVRRHVRPVAARGRRPLARRPRRPAPERCPVRAVGRAHRARRRAADPALIGTRPARRT